VRRWAVFLDRQRNATLVIRLPKMRNRLASAHAPGSPRGFADRSFREPAKPTGEHCMHSSS